MDGRLNTNLSYLSTLNARACLCLCETQKAFFHVGNAGSPSVVYVVPPNSTPARTRGKRRTLVNHRSRAPVGVDVRQCRGKQL